MIKRLRKLSIFKKYPIGKQYIKFCLVGIINFSVDFVIYFVLTRFFRFYYLLASFFSFVLAVTVSFYGNSRWTFRGSCGNNQTSSYFKFFVANSISMAISLVFFYVLVDFLGWHDLWAKLMVNVAVSVLNFCLNKFWTFRIVKSA